MAESNSPIQPFLYGDKTIRMISQDGEAWFVAKDVADALGIAWQGEKSVASIKSEWRMVGNLPTTNGDRDTILLREPAVYKLAFRSNKAEAERFTDWLAGEVLPAIRRTGRYEAAAASSSGPCAPRSTSNDNRVRFAKMNLVSATMRLDELGVDVSAIDMRAVIDFGRKLNAIGGR